MAADMKTIAQMLGVSKTTVHRALADTGRISPHTKARILELARELDYRPNNLARGLRSQKSGTVGVLVIGIQSSFSAGIVAGIEDVAGQQGYSVLMACSHGFADNEMKHLDLLREQRVDGMIIAPADPGANLDYYRKMMEADIPFVLIDRYLPDLDTDYVVTDNFHGGFTAARHLIAQGRRTLAFLTTSCSERNSTSVRDRHAGFVACLKEHGLTPVGTMGEDIPDMEPAEEFARQAVEKFLAEHEEGVDGVLAVTDHFAVGAMRGLMDNGLRVPDDVAVVGYDDVDVARFVNPALTTIRQPQYMIGERAFRILMDRIGDRSGSSRQTRHIQLQPELIIRESCGGSVHFDSSR